MTMPTSVFVTDVGPRDGLQMEKQVLSAEQKLALIRGLAGAGLPAIQVASFVHPQKVPQMADAEAVIAALPDDGVAYSALTLNRRGVERACDTPIPWIEVSLSASETQSRHNTGMSVEQAAGQVREMMALAKAAGRKIRGSIQCSFGCVHECEIDTGQVGRLAELLLEGGGSAAAGRHHRHGNPADGQTAPGVGAAAGRGGAGGAAPARHPRAGAGEPFGRA
jgi:hydroxymethylglutaryl-CoA lyase